MKRFIFTLLILILLGLSHLGTFWLGVHGGYRKRQFSDAQLINYGYSLGWNEGLSMTEIPGAEIIDLSTGTKRVVPEK